MSSGALSISQQDEINRQIERLASGESIRATQWPSEISPIELGLLVVDGNLTLPPHTDLLAYDTILASVPAATRSLIKELVVLRAVGSTNALMMAMAENRSVSGLVLTSEVQTAGRGRRGRQWRSPFARNLAVTVGMMLQMPMQAIGGLSSVIGIALANELQKMQSQKKQKKKQKLQQLQISANPVIGLKWPNDLWVERRKLAGILVELSQTSNGIQVVAGFGVNVALSDVDRAAIDQPVADLRECGVDATRSELVGRLAGSVLAAIAEFQRTGFAPFVEEFNALHVFHGAEVVVTSATDSRQGRVTGINAAGELLLATRAGVDTIIGGEVSLRPF